MSVFLNKNDGRDFVLLASAVFLAFVSHSTLAFLSVILRDTGRTASEIGVVLSTPLLPILIGMYVSGHLVDRFGTMRIIRSGFLLMLISFLSLHLTVTGFAGVVISRVAYGIGYGIFMPAGMVYIKNRLQPHRMVSMVGVYGSMLLLPNLIGPALMEHLYGRVGLANLFIYTALPVALANGLMFLARPEAPGLLRADPGGYFGLLKKRDLHLPSMLLLVVGLVYGFVPTLMALLLKENSVPVANFFVPFTTVLFFTRFFVLPIISHWPRKVLVLTGLLLMAASHLTVREFAAPGAAMAAGAMFGLGYAFEYPTISVWVARLFKQEDRGKPVAWANMVFHAGIFLTPLLGGWIMELWSVGTVSLVLAGLALISGILLLFLKVPELIDGVGGGD
jgi:MFS family permease